MAGTPARVLSIHPCWEYRAARSGAVDAARLPFYQQGGTHDIARTWNVAAFDSANPQPSQLPFISGTKTNGPRFTMSQTAVVRLEGSRTHDGFKRLYFKGPWVDQCPICNKDGIACNCVLMCDFCPRTFTNKHHGVPSEHSTGGD